MHVEFLKIWFVKRKYPNNRIQKQVEKALTLTPSDENNSKKVNGVPLLTYMQTKKLKKFFHLHHLFPSEALET